MADTSAVRRNGPCPCGSGRKYKFCCGKKPGGGGAARAGRPGGPPVSANREILRAANEHHQAGRLEIAADLYQQFLEREPRDAAGLYYAGRLMAAMGRLDEGIRLLRRSIAVDSARGRAHAELGSQLLRNRQPEECIASMERALALAPDDIVVLTTAAGCLARVNRLDEAITAAEHARTIAPDHAPCLVALARLREQSGDREEAKRLLESALAQPGLDPGARHAALHQLGVVLDKLGSYDAAMETVERAGALTLQLPRARSIDPSRLSARIADYRASISRADLERITANEVADGRPAPVFLMGFPRSGTTLTEQILATHSRVVATDEEPLIPGIVAESRRSTDAAGTTMTDLLKGLDVGEITRLRTLYRQRADGIIKDGVGDRILLDKLPLNTVDIALINMIFPDARVLFILRDPRDICVSCMMQLWQGVPMYHFSSLETTVAFYAEVMALWIDLRDRITLPYLESRYEDAVDDPAAHARRLLEFLNLEWTDDVLRFHERQSERYLYSLSYRDVAQPIYNRAVARWESYRKHFEPHQATLAPFLEAFGY